MTQYETTWTILATGTLSGMVQAKYNLKPLFV